MKFFRILVFVFLLLITFGCTNLPPRVVSATLGTDVQAGKIVKAKEIFASADHMIHLVVEVENIASATTVGAKWYSVSPPERLLFESDLKLDAFNTSADFTLTSTGDWKPGSYKVVVYLDGTENRTLNFVVQGE